MITVFSYKKLWFNLIYMKYLCPVYFYKSDRSEFDFEGTTYKRVFGNIYKRY